MFITLLSPKRTNISLVRSAILHGLLLSSALLVLGIAIGSLLDLLMVLVRDHDDDVLCARDLASGAG